MFKVLENGTEPTRGSKYSACVDLYASEDVTIVAGETVLVGLGVAIDENFVYELSNVKIIKEMYLDIIERVDEQSKADITPWQDSCSVMIADFMKSHYLQLMLRSSLGKKGLILPNGVGVIDLDYKDEIKMIIHNPVSNNLIVKISTFIFSVSKDFPTVEKISKLLDLQLQEDVRIKKGQKIAQVTLLEHKGYLFGIESEEERTGGFGSTDGCKVVL